MIFFLPVSGHKAKELKAWLNQQSDAATPPDKVNVMMDVKFKNNLDLVREKLKNVMICFLKIHISRLSRFLSKIYVDL